MSLVPQKRSRPSLPVGPTRDGMESTKFPDIGLFLVERKMGSSRRSFLTALARRKGFCVEEAYSERVTHVIAEHNSGAEVMQWLVGQPAKREEGRSPILLHISWFTECMAAGEPVKIEPRHLLEVQMHSDVAVSSLVATYGCLRRTPLTNRNHVFTDALETLAKEAAFCGSEGRSLAFIRAASVLRSLPSTLTTMEELSRMPGFGEHSKRVVQEILEDGSSAEVERVTQEERYQTMKLFTNIFGVGIKTANKWYQEGLRSIGDLRNSQKKLKLTKQQETGLQHYEDLTMPVSHTEADLIAKMVEEVAHRFLPGTIITLAGGFRRGKLSGHDVDILITHPQEGREEGLLSKVISQLQSQHFERELRRFSSHEKKMVLNSHALYDTVQQTFLAATSEEDIFMHLGLEYIPPSDRNA
ncbi:DNA-directed DNA/RNA polymerase mu isoform X2 [Microcaecilia unicolor]|uniref:DNA-directed DNA/RNA polymerase mu n=1 Tax=Microcaecilia unicolor TaxID=1415580 RepID=A0A6P7XQ83_9AMPH|nr:DNA-directed DNA/RNA polymerase mu isoform X2 [Microcaecilia unicolor]